MSEQRLQVALCHQSAESRNTLHAAVSRLGHDVCFHSGTGRELVEQSRLSPPDLIIVQQSLPDMNGRQAAKRAAGETAIPTVVVLDRHDGCLLDDPDSDNVLAVLQEPVRVSDLIPVIPLAMKHFQRLQELQESIALLKVALGEEL